MQVIGSNFKDCFKKKIFEIPFRSLMTKDLVPHASDIRLFLIKLIVYILIVFPHIISVGIIFSIVFYPKVTEQKGKGHSTQM